MSCATPISWLALERYHLGEVDADGRREIEAHLRSCDVCSGELAEIQSSARKLPTLPTPHLVRWRRGLVIGGALAAAAALLLWRREPAEKGDRWKGDSVTFTLVREDEVIVSEAGGVYRDGERFKALVSCPPSLQVTFELVVYEQGAPPAFPLVTPLSIECGNAIPLSGAFRLTGRAPLTVCVVWRPSGEGPIDRSTLMEPEIPRSLCTKLEAAHEEPSE